MTMATLIAFMLGKKITLKDRLLMQEEMNVSTLQGIVLLTKRVLLVTICLEIIGVVFLFKVISEPNIIYLIVIGFVSILVIIEILLLAKFGNKWFMKL